MSSPTSTWPLISGAALALVAFTFAWPEPLAGGWEGPSAAAALAGLAASAPFWAAARAEAAQEAKPQGLNVVLTAAAGAFTAVVLLHLLNAAPPAGRAQTVVLAITDSYTQRSTGRRSRTRHYVITAPAPGPVAIPTRHQVGGLFDGSGSWFDYQPGGCMALRWRPGLLWPVVRQRRAIECPPGLAMPPPAPPPLVDPAPGIAELPPARPGPGWRQVQDRLETAIGRLDLPRGGARLALEVEIDGDGRIIVARRDRQPGPATERLEAAVMPALMGRADALAGPAGTYRLSLRLMPPADEPCVLMDSKRRASCL